MAPNQATDGNVSFGGRFPSNVKTASQQWAAHLNVENPADNIGESHVYRQAIYEFYLNHWEDVPGEVREQVGKEWLQGQVDGGIGVDL